MGGFVSGFQTGYGLVQDTIEAKRRQTNAEREQELARERIEREKRRDAELADYREGTLGIQRERLGIERSRAEREARESREESAARRAERMANAELRGAQAREIEQQTEINEAKLGQIRQREAFQKFVASMSGNAPEEQSIEALRELEGTTLHPSYYLSPQFADLQRTAAQFASGQRTDYDSPDFLKAVDHALKSDTDILRGIRSRRPGMGAIRGAEVIGVEPVGAGYVDGGQSGLKVRLRVDAENGSYESYITTGRSLDPDAQPAVVPVDRIMENLNGMQLMRYAFERDPEFRKEIRRRIYQSDPERYERAVEAGARAYRDYEESKKSEGGELDQILGESVGARELTREDFIDQSLATEFGPYMPGALEADPSGARTTSTQTGASAPDIQQLRDAVRAEYGDAVADEMTEAALRDGYERGMIQLP